MIIKVKKNKSKNKIIINNENQNNFDFLIKKNNIEIKTNFNKIIISYHIIHKDVIKESSWEEINYQIFINSNIHVSNISNGSHKSGIDLQTIIGNFSNKTGKIINTICNISSYRLSSVCNNKNIGDIDLIIEEIEKRNKSFDYYSFLLRKEYKDNIEYFWYIIPKNADFLNVKNMIGI